MRIALAVACSLSLLSPVPVALADGDCGDSEPEPPADPELYLPWIVTGEWLAAIAARDAATLVRLAPSTVVVDLAIPMVPMVEGCAHRGRQKLKGATKLAKLASCLHDAVAGLGAPSGFRKLDDRVVFTWDQPVYCATDTGFRFEITVAHDGDGTSPRIVAMTFTDAGCADALASETSEE